MIGRIARLARCRVVARVLPAEVQPLLAAELGHRGPLLGDDALHGCAQRVALKRLPIAAARKTQRRRTRQAHVACEAQRLVHRLVGRIRLPLARDHGALASRKAVRYGEGRDAAAIGVVGHERVQAAGLALLVAHRGEVHGMEGRKPRFHQLIRCRAVVDERGFQRCHRGERPAQVGGTLIAHRRGKPLLARVERRAQSRIVRLLGVGAGFGLRLGLRPIRRERLDHDVPHAVFRVHLRITAEPRRRDALLHLISGKFRHIAPRGTPVGAVEALARVRHGPLRLHVAALGLVGVVGIVGRHLERQVRALVALDALHHGEPLPRAQGHRLVERDGVVAAVLHRLGLARRQRAVGGIGRVAVEQVHLHLHGGVGVRRGRRHSLKRLVALGREHVGRRGVPELARLDLAHARSAQVIILVVRIVAERAVRIGQIDQEGRGLANAHVVVRQVETAVQAPVGAPAVLDDPRTSGGRLLGRIAGKCLRGDRVVPAHDGDGVVGRRALVHFGRDRIILGDVGAHVLRPRRIVEILAFFAAGIVRIGDRARLIGMVAHGHRAVIYKRALDSRRGIRVVRVIFSGGIHRIGEHGGAGKRDHVLHMHGRDGAVAFGKRPVAEVLFRLGIGIPIPVHIRIRDVGLVSRAEPRGQHGSGNAVVAAGVEGELGVG